MSGAPINSIQKIIDYMWDDEERHFSEQEKGDPLRKTHIFYDVKKVKAWLDKMERSGE